MSVLCAPRVRASACALFLAMASRAAAANAAGDEAREEGALALGAWRAVLESPGGELPFGLILERNESGVLGARFENGAELLPVPSCTLEGRTLRLDVPHYASRIVATLAEDGRHADGVWSKRSGPDAETRMSFRAEFGAAPRFPPFPGGAPGRGADPTGRWAVQFSSSEEPAVGQFFREADGAAHGTFLTSTGDYRYLAGDCGTDADGRTHLRLSCFDGAHAFLFHAELGGDGTLTGDFWSRDRWHETWTAVRDENATLPDGFAAVHADPEVDPAQLSYPDLSGTLHSLRDPGLVGRATLYYLFGSWCPNCHDATRFLKELAERHGPQGLRVVGLAFELAEDPERDRLQLARYREHFAIDWPILLVGPADKVRARVVFPWVDRVASYPTFLFVDAEGRVRAIYSGYSGPATGEAHTALRASFESAVESLLAETER